MIATEKEISYKTVPDGVYYYGVTIIDHGVYRLMMWSDFLGAEGTDREVKLTFRLYDVMIKGSSLLQLMRDAKRHKIDMLAVHPRHQSMMGGEGLIVTEIVVREAKP